MTRWMALRWILVALIGLGHTTAAFGQESTGPEPKIQKVIRLQHISAQQAQMIIAPLAGPDVEWSFVPELKIVSVRARASRIEEIETLLREVDIPPTAASSPSLNVVLTGYLVGASDAAQGDIPGQVRDAVTEIRRHFPYKSYTLLETFAIRTQVNTRAQLSGLTTIDHSLPALRYSVTAQLGDVSESGPRRIVQIRELQSGWSLPVESKPGEYMYESPSVRASLNISEGTTVVVGKAGAVGAYQGIFLLLKAEVVDP